MTTQGYGHGVGASTDCFAAGEVRRHALDAGGLSSTGGGRSVTGVADGHWSVTDGRRIFG